MSEAREEIDELIRLVIDVICDEVEGAKSGDEVYFHDLIHEEVDRFIAGDTTRSRLIDLIDECNNESTIDRGLVDMSDLDRILITTAYACVYDKIFEDDTLQELQRLLNNEEITEETKKRIAEIKEEFDE